MKYDIYIKIYNKSFYNLTNRKTAHNSFKFLFPQIFQSDIFNSINPLYSNFHLQLDFFTK